MSGVARSNPSAVPYAPDAYADQAAPVAPPTQGPVPAPLDEEDRTNPLRLGRGHRGHPAAGGHRVPGLPARRWRRCDAVRLTVAVAIGRRRDRPEFRRHQTSSMRTPRRRRSGSRSCPPASHPISRSARSFPRTSWSAQSVPVGSEVNVTVASGADTVPVPALIDLHEGGGAPGDRRGRSGVGQAERRLRRQRGRGARSSRRTPGRHCRGEGHVRRLRRVEGP